jgi:hypothetical protein
MMHSSRMPLARIYRCFIGCSELELGAGTCIAKLVDHCFMLAMTPVSTGPGQKQFTREKRPNHAMFGRRPKRLSGLKKEPLLSDKGRSPAGDAPSAGSALFARRRRMATNLGAPSSCFFF